MKPLMNAAEFAGIKEASDGDAVAKLLNNTPNDHLMQFAEKSTGLSFSLLVQHKTTVNELRNELKQSLGSAPA
jgi:hypothetical protein